MSFNAKEISEYSGEPRELFWFMRGSDSWTYASGIETVTVNSATFVPLTGISRSNIVYGKERSRSQLTVTVPRDTPLALEFRGIPHVEPVWLNLYKIHDGEIDYRITWQGRIRFVETKGNNAIITLDEITASTKKSALRYKFQNQCNNFTFDLNCGLFEADFQTDNVPVDSIDVNTLTLDDSQIDGYYTAGQVKRADGDRRMIVSDTKVGSTHTLELLTAFENMEVGEEVSIIGGACRHTFSTCQTVVDKEGTPIDNHANYGGYPLVPRKNPFKSIN